MKTVDVTYRIITDDNGMLFSIRLISEVIVPETSHDVYARSTSAGVRVRIAPVTGLVIGGLVFNQRVKILERKNGWARIESPAGWVSETLLKFE